MGVKSELLGWIDQVAAVITLPVITDLYLPEPQPHAGSPTEFGVVVLADGMAGLYYAWLGDVQKGMNARYHTADYRGQSPLALAGLFASTDMADCSLGLAAINAISQSVFKSLRVPLIAATDSFAHLDLQAGDHVGMVGYFPSLVERLQQAQIRLTIIEKKARFLKFQGAFEISDDPGRLAGCNKICTTAATLLNDSMDEILAHASGAEEIIVIGPTAGFLPDPLFARRVSALGGMQINNAGRAIANLKAGRGLADAASKYVLSQRHYAGLPKLLEQVHPDQLTG